MKTLHCSLLLSVCSTLFGCSSASTEHARSSRAALATSGDITGAYRYQLGDRAMDSLSLFGDSSYTAVVVGSNEAGSYSFDGQTLALVPGGGSERDYSVTPIGSATNAGMELVGQTDSTDETLSFVGGACNVVADCAGEPVQPNVALCLLGNTVQTQCVNSACVAHCAAVACTSDADCPASSVCGSSGQCAVGPAACNLTPSNDDDNFDALVVRHTWTSTDTLSTYTFNADQSFTSVDQPTCTIAQPVHCELQVASKTGTLTQTGLSTFELDYDDGTVGNLTVEMDCKGSIAAASVSDYGQTLTLYPPRS